MGKISLYGLLPMLALSLVPVPVSGSTDALTAQAPDSSTTVAIDEVVVTGTRSGADPRLLPMTVNVVDRPQLTARGETNLLPTLTQDVPGLFVTQRGVLGYSVSTGGSGGIKVRGIGGAPNTDVLVLIDGLPQYAGLYGHPIADNYQTFMAERVEVVRGPASLYYGSNALGGVINIITRRPQADTVQSAVHLQGGSYATFDAGASNLVRKGRFSSAVGVNYSRTDGHRANMDFEQYNAFCRLGWAFNPHWQLTGSGNVAYFSTQNPGPVAAPIVDSRYNVLRGMAALSLENDHKDSRFPSSGAIRLYYNGGKHDINEGHRAEAPALAQDYHHTDFMAGASAYQAVDFFKGNRTTFGLDYQHFGGHAWNAVIADGSTTDLVSKDLFEAAGYIDFRQQLAAWLVLDAGIRLGWNSQAGFNYAPQAGLSFVLPHEAEIKALASRGYRNPTIRELYMYKPANEALEAVKLWSYELSYRQQLLERRLRLGLNLFYLHAANNIETRMIDGKPLNVNTGEFENSGVEAEISYHSRKGLVAGANYSYLFMAHPTLAAPRHKVNLQLGYHHERFRIGTSVQYIAGLYTALATADIPAVEQHFLLCSAHASVRIWKGLWAQVKADNLLAQDYEINAGFPMPKATVMGGFNWTF
ncbi:MAG: TonB-dependent receptor [Paludibacteraceae bacterium]|nr:TonB-dependent receptor [Paludibacteraceae bacterium]